jgi:hypothetical protein
MVDGGKLNPFSRARNVFGWRKERIVNCRFGAVLPDGIHFSYQKSQFGHILDGLDMQNFVIFYCNLLYYAVIWYIFWWPICIFSPFGYVLPMKSGNPGVVHS